MGPGSPQVNAARLRGRVAGSCYRGAMEKDKDKDKDKAEAPKPAAGHWINPVFLTGNNPGRTVRSGIVSRRTKKADQPK